MIDTQYVDTLGDVGDKYHAYFAGFIHLGHIVIRFFGTHRWSKL